jgi:hypothetical protein
MTCVAVVLFPHASIAVQVLVTVNLPGHIPGVVTSCTVTFTAKPQIDVADTAVGSAAGISLKQLTVMGPGVPEIIGGVLGVIV